MRPLLRLSSAIDALSTAVGKAAGWAVLAMVLIGAFNAVARYASKWVGTNLSSNAYLEAQWYLFSLVFLFGASYALQRDAHVRVDVLYGRLGARAKAWIDVAGSILFLLPFCAFALWVSWGTVVNSFNVREVSPDPGGLPRWPIKMALLPAFALLGVQGISELIKAVDRALTRVPETS